MRQTLAIIGMLGAILLMVPAATIVRAQEQPPGAGEAQAQDADGALAEFRAVRPPVFDRARQDDAEYRREYQEQMKATMQRKVELARAFYDRFPDHPEAGKVMQERWQILPMLGQSDVVAQETEAALARDPNSPVAAAARFSKAQATLQSQADFEAKLQAIEEFIAANPQDPRGGDLLLQLASWGRPDDQQQRALLERIRREYPDSRAARSAEGLMRQLEGIGKPFELSFTDAVSGKPISMSDLKGKVVVVDFWATWCGPCVAEMPKMKSLYEQYQPQGVEFIGISLDAPEDQGGLEALKKFVAENDIPWPQYYQGKGWQSEFSSSWGINSIPALFIIDADGKLSSTSARGKLETLIPELIAKRDGKQATAR